MTCRGTNPRDCMADELRARIDKAERDGGKWREAALRVGESLIDHGPEGYYQMTPEAWLSWALVALKQSDSASVEQETRFYGIHKTISLDEAREIFPPSDQPSSSATVPLTADGHCALCGGSVGLSHRCVHNVAVDPDKFVADLLSASKCCVCGGPFHGVSRCPIFTSKDRQPAITIIDEASDVPDSAWDAEYKSPLADQPEAAAK